MQWTTVKEHWPAFVAPIMQRWDNADESDLVGLDGDRVALTRYIAARHELTPSEAEEQIAVWLDGAVPSDVVMDPEMDNERITASGDSIPEGEDVYDDDREFGDDNVTASPVGRTE
jgi:hypothetical protein